MNKLEWEASGYTIELSTASVAYLNDSLIPELSRRLGSLKSRVDCISLDMTAVEGEVHPTFDYVIELRDGRKWKHRITFDVAGDPLLTFKATEPWRRSEYEEHFPLRQTVGLIQEKFGIVKLKVRWP